LPPSRGDFTPNMFNIFSCLGALKFKEYTMHHIHNGLLYSPSGKYERVLGYLSLTCGSVLKV